MMLVTVVCSVVMCCTERERGRKREGGYLSVSCALHCPGQTELAYSPRVCPPSLEPTCNPHSPHHHQHTASSDWLSDKYKYYNSTVQSSRLGLARSPARNNQTSLD